MHFVGNKLVASAMDICIHASADYCIILYYMLKEVGLRKLFELSERNLQNLSDDVINWYKTGEL